jgi:hypothetical protein
VFAGSPLRTSVKRHQGRFLDYEPRLRDGPPPRHPCSAVGEYEQLRDESPERNRRKAAVPPRAWIRWRPIKRTCLHCRKLRNVFIVRITNSQRRLRHPSSFLWASDDK